MSDDILLSGRGLTRRYPVPKTTLFERRTVSTALDDADIDIRSGSAVGVIGESGSGKSTLVRLLLGLDVPTAGSVAFDGRAVDAAAGARALHWLRRETGIVFQDPYASLDPRMSVGRIVGEPLWALGLSGDGSPGSAGRRERVAEVLEDVGLDAAMAARFPHEFSGGQRQRIALARALVHRPRLLVGDEPLSALDVTVRAQILEEGPTEKVLLQPQVAYTRRLLASIPSLDPDVAERG
jgi:ABC-type microcin C transport system duplicated ATPase subunit YejF